MLNKTRLAIFDLTDVLSDKTLAVELLKYRPEGWPYFISYGRGEIGEREIVIEGSKVFKGLPQNVIREEAYKIRPRIDELNLPGWETAIVSLDYFEIVERIATILNISHYYGNRIIYENGLHSGIVKEPIVDFEQKKVIVSDLKAELNPNLIVALDNLKNSPFRELCDRFFLVKTKEELECALTKIRGL